MKTAAVAELKAGLSHYLRRVKAGEEILVTERTVPIARLVPVEGGAAGFRELRELERQGLIRLGTGSLPKSFWAPRRGKDAQGSVRKAVRRERDEGW
jgi:prevent-host-death family protein